MHNKKLARRLRAFAQLPAELLATLRQTRRQYAALLIILSTVSVSLSAMVTSGYYHGRRSDENLLVEGFQKYFISTNQQGQILITEENIRIIASNSSFAKVFPYSAVDDFNWNFSAIPVGAVGLSYIVAFSVEWGQKNISVWAESPGGWYCYSNINESLAYNRIPLGGPIRLGSSYEVRVDWRLDRKTRAIRATIFIKSQTWRKELSFDIPENPLPPALGIGAWASEDSYVEVDYNQSILLNTRMRYIHESSTTVILCILTSLALVSITAVVTYARFGELFLSIKQAVRRKIFETSDILRRVPRTIAVYIKNNRGFLCMLLFFTVARFWLAFYIPGHWFDNYAFKAWTQTIADHGTTAIYPYTAILPPVIIRPVYPYPPVVAYVFSAIAYFLLPLTSTDNLLMFWFKVTPILADLALGWVTYETIKSWKGARLGLVAAALSLCNIVNSAIWGQYDSVVALFIVLSALYAVKGRVGLSWMFAAAATATKMTALPFLPGLLIVSIKQRGWYAAFIGLGVFSLTSIGIWAPFLLNGYSLDFALWQTGFGLVSSTGAFSPASSEMTSTTVFAPNIWPIINALKDKVSPTMSFLGVVRDNLPNQFLFFTYFQLGVILFAVFYFCILYTLRKATTPQNVMFRLSLLMIVFFMFPTRMHERYIHLALPLLVLAYKETRAATASYVALLAAFSVTLLSALSIQWVPLNIVNFFAFLPNASDWGLMCLVLTNISVTSLMIYKSLRR